MLFKQKTSEVQELKSLLGFMTVGFLGDDKLHDLVTAYCEPWRHYHNLSHPISMLRALNTLDVSRAPDEDLLPLRLMILYHDVIYKVGERSNTNEELSAVFFKDHTGDRLHPKQCDTVMDGILLSKSHLPTGHIGKYPKDILLFLDLDLMSLGASSEEFRSNTESIWLESQPVITRPEFDAGCAKWAREFLKRDRIYHTSYLKHLERSAQYNLERLL